MGNEYSSFSLKRCRERRAEELSFFYRVTRGGTKRVFHTKVGMAYKFVSSRRKRVFISFV